MNNAKIKRILRRQIFIELLTEMFLVSISIIILYLSIFYSALVFIVFVFYNMILIAAYFLISRNASVFIPIYRVNKYSKSKTIDLVNSLIDQYTLQPSSSDNKNVNFFSNSPFGSNAPIRDGMKLRHFKASRRMGRVGMESGPSNRVLNRNVKTLKKLKILLVGSKQTKSNDIWDQ